MALDIKILKIFTDSGDIEYQSEFSLDFKCHRLVYVANDCSRIPCDTNITYLCVTVGGIYIENAY